MAEHSVVFFGESTINTFAWGDALFVWNSLKTRQKKKVVCHVAKKDSCEGYLNEKVTLGLLCARRLNISTPWLG